MKKYGLVAIFAIVIAVLLSGSAFAMTGDREEMDNTEMLETPTLRYRVHSETGWSRYCWGEETAGSTGTNHPIDSFSLGMAGNNMLILQYQVYTSEEGWSEWCRSNRNSGKPGTGYGIKGIKLMLSGRATMYHNIYVQVYVTGKGWQPWVKDAQVAGDLNNNIEAVRIKAD